MTKFRNYVIRLIRYFAGGFELPFGLLITVEEFIVVARIRDAFRIRFVERQDIGDTPSHADVTAAGETATDVTATDVTATGVTATGVTATGVTAANGPSNSPLQVAFAALPGSSNVYNFRSQAWETRAEGDETTFKAPLEATPSRLYRVKIDEGGQPAPE